MPTTLVPCSQSTRVGSAAAIVAQASAGPPAIAITAMGVRINASTISVACTASVQLTARKPPISV